MGINNIGYHQSRISILKPLENQFIYPIPKGSKLILTSSSSSTSCRRFLAPLGDGVNEENQWENIKSKIYIINLNDLFICKTQTNYLIFANNSIINTKIYNSLKDKSGRSFSHFG